MSASSLPASREECELLGEAACLGWPRSPVVAFPVSSRGRLLLGPSPPGAVSCVYQLCPVALEDQVLVGPRAWTAVWGLPAPGPQGRGAECHFLSLSPALPSVPRPPGETPRSKFH